VFAGNEARWSADGMDRVTQTLLDALRLALSEPGDRRLYRVGKLDGLFPGRGGVGAEAAPAPWPTDWSSPHAPKPGARPSSSGCG